MIRKAQEKDISAINAIYDALHSRQERNEIFVGWVRGVYPTEDTARKAVMRGDMFVMDKDGEILAAAVINQQQVDVYEDGNWEYEADDCQVMVLHTLVVSPEASRKGLGSEFVSFYEAYAKENNCDYLRMDTNAGNEVARSLYKKLGYREISIVPCVFNGISGVPLVLLEKYIG